MGPDSFVVGGIENQTVTADIVKNHPVFTGNVGVQVVAETGTFLLFTAGEQKEKADEKKIK
jgi:hypothetical protein